MTPVFKTLIAATGLFCASAYATDRIEGVEVDLLLPMDVAIDADHRFVRADQDRNGLIDADEFAADAVVTANLARLRRALYLQSDEDLVVRLPAGVGEQLTAAERTRLDHQARDRFAFFAALGAPMDRDQFIEVKTIAFDHADIDGDGVLDGPETALYAAAVAGHKPVTS